MGVYWGEGKKITISEMMMLMVKRKHKITDDDHAGSSPTGGLLEEGIKEVLLFKIDIFFVLVLLVFIFKFLIQVLSESSSVFTSNYRMLIYTRP